MRTASELGLRVEDAVVLHESDRLAVRLMPCDVLARVAVERSTWLRSAEFELQVARRLAEAGSPAGLPEPRVNPRAYVRDGFVITLWTYYDRASLAGIAPSVYAGALARLHAGMRRVDFRIPHFMHRVASAESLVDNRAQTPRLSGRDRDLLRRTLVDLGAAVNSHGAVQQPLHGEPHPGNVLQTQHGLLFIDLETCCRGPVEFDIAHAPEDVALHYPGADQDLVRECRLLILAMIATWRFNRDDRLPNGPRLGSEWLNQLRAARGGAT